ncbi:MAG: alpha/beta fold hydrolase, partial [Burkholderiaceae bacterium]|jgi:arthrofactin-type cyclic lipopeptide synthetase C|nr:alpha/beta fold hydrolase [Burkholderiaceae bacterium]
LPAPEGEAYARRGYEAPEGEIEQKLAQIWSELLKIERVGRHDNFFELGGHSLLAVQLLGALKREGLSVSLSQVFSYPSVQALAKEMLNHCPNQMNVVSFRIDGNAPPLFLVHEVFGEISSWGNALTRHIDANIPVYGLTADQSYKRKLRTLQGMATCFIRAIREIQPKGPYRIAGWSFGGMLAYEIASQLIGDNESVKFLGLLDTYYNTTKKVVTESDILYQKILEQNPSDAALKELNSIDSTDLDALLRKCVELSLVPEGLDALTLVDVRSYLSLARMHIEASNMYEVKPIDIPVHLFIAQDNNASEPSLGWGKTLSEDQLSSILVPGDHKTMVNEPNVAALGAEISRCIHEQAEKTIQKTTPEDLALVSIRTTLRAKGSLFCIPGAGGSVASFASLADALDEHWKVYGLQPRGLNGIDVPHSTISAAASTYLKALDEACPVGPVHLLGHSFGGWVAFEMALRLQEAGRPASSLTLIDTEAPQSDPDYIREYTRVDVLMKLVEIWEMTLESSLGINRETLESLESTEQLALLHQQAVKAQLMPRQTTPDILTGTIRTMAAALRTTYHPGATYPVPANLVLLTDPKLEHHAQEQEFVQVTTDWRRWIPGLEAWRGPGNHMTALKPQYAPALANWLCQKLNQRAS